jgi:hypothetical protein
VIEDIGRYLFVDVMPVDRSIQIAKRPVMQRLLPALGTDKSTHPVPVPVSDFERSEETVSELDVPMNGRESIRIKFRGKDLRSVHIREQELGVPAALDRNIVGNNPDHHLE